METARTRALKQLATTMPVANQQVAQGMQQARLMGLQRAVTQAPTPGSGTPGTGIREMQAAGGQQAGAAAEIQTGAAKQVAEATGAIGAAGVQELKRVGAEDVGQAGAAVRELESDQADKLSTLGRGIKQELFDSRVQFERDESGHKLMNESQLADWAVSKTKSAEELKSKMQTMQLAHDRKMQLLQTAQSKVVAALEFQYQKKGQDRDQATIKALEVAKQELELKMQKEAADAANKQAMWQAGGTILGGAVGALGGPAGAAAGASLGGAVGTAAGSQAAK